jgi:hypothetical protein
MAIVSAVCPSYVNVDRAHILCLSCRVWCGDIFDGGSWAVHTGARIRPGGWGHTGVGGVC